MEQVIYSGTLDNGETFGFYCCEKGAIPEGLEKVHELSISEHGKLVCEIPEEKRLAWDRETGMPSWEDIPEATAEKAEQQENEINQQSVKIDVPTTKPLSVVIAGKAEQQENEINQSAKIDAATTMPLSVVIAGKAEQRKNEINQQFVQIDVATIRHLRAVIAGTETDSDREKLTELEAEAKLLRGELKALNNI